MTTIAVTKNQIACDLQISHNSGYKFKGKTKLYEFESSLVYPKPFCVGYCGNTDAVVPVLDWLVNPTTKPPKIVSTEFLVLTSDHKIYTFNSPNDWMLVDQPIYAIGSGSLLAIGAMEAGASAIEAVKIASKYDPSTGMGFRKVDY
jgi:hypothetical protein